MKTKETKWPREKKLFMAEWKQVRDDLMAAVLLRQNNLELRWMASGAAAGFLSPPQIYLLTTSLHTQHSVF